MAPRYGSFLLEPFLRLSVRIRSQQDKIAASVRSAAILSYERVINIMQEAQLFDHPTGK